MLDSKTWRLTKPLRIIGNGVIAIFCRKLNNAMNDDSYKSTYKLIKKSGFFDKRYYLMQNIDIANSKTDPLRHFVEFGWKEGRSPSLKFDTKYYMESNPDVRDSDMNPLVHYIRFGQYEGRAVGLS